MARTVDKKLTDRRKRQIMQAAMRCFAAKGFHRSTMQDICGEAGLSPGALYHYFDSKDAIITGVAGLEVERSRELAAHLEGADDLEGALSAIADWLSIGAENREGYQVYMEMVCEAGRNEGVARELALADEIAFGALRSRLELERLSIGGVSAEVFSEYLGWQIAILDLYRRLEPSDSKNREMARLFKHSLRELLASSRPSS